VKFNPQIGAAVIRYAGTVAATVLVAIQPSYPNAHWIDPTMLALTYLGFHAVPTAVQVVRKLIPAPAAPVPATPVTVSYGHGGSGGGSSNQGGSGSSVTVVGGGSPGGAGSANTGNTPGGSAA